MLTALSIIVPYTGLFETCRCPKHRKVIFDQGSKFKLGFKEICKTYSIMRVHSSCRDPQRNVIIEIMCLVLLNMISSLELSDVTWEDEERIWDIHLTKSSWATRFTCKTTLKHTSGELYFNRDYVMFECLWTHV